ncbi:cell wall protein Ecm33 [Emydomyces testavorans]|uniref:Cell wall protein Ecm33 n=1 Tax=Emydomyces testavorans TaxID=2070801 RepID=A0AAF0II42_9EURO|nr:cell wall protein Ecm33 [Emydomyces testavorans]
MAFIKFLLPALAITGLAAAASGDCDSKTIQNQGDADALASCKTISGNLEISPKASGTISISGVERITGKFTCKGAENMTELSASKLASIEDTFMLSGLTTLATLKFDALSQVNSINFEALPRLQQLSFSKGVTKADRVRITNTDLVNLNGIDLETVGDMDISNNPHLTEVNVNKITNATGYVSFSANHVELKIKFPNLANALNMTFRNASVVSLPSLKQTAGLLGFYSNFFQDFSAPNLTSTGDLVFNDNSQLGNISLPALQTVKGAFQIANNTNLKAVTEVPKLQTITGALDFTGNFSQVDLSGLKEVRGQFNMQSSGKLDCGPFDKDVKPNVRGKYTCRGGVDDPQSSDPSRTGGNKPNKSGLAGPGAVPPSGMTILALLGIVVRFAL